MGGNITNPFISPELQAMTGTQFLGKLIGVAITLSIIVGAVAFIFMIITAGISLITSGGDKSATEQARQKLTFAFVGLFVLVAVFVIINLVQNLFNINLLLFNIPTLG